MAHTDEEWSKYRTTVREFDSVLEHAKAVSASIVGLKPVDRSQIFGEQIFVKVLAHCVTLRQLSPDPARQTSKELWDLPSVAAVARCVIEAHDAFAYITSADVTDAEKDFRFTLWELHDKTRRLKMLEAIGSSDPRNAQIRSEADRLLSLVTAHARFASLPVNIRKKLTTDPPAFYLSQRDRCAECSVDYDFYNGVTMLLSQYVHTLPFSIQQLFGFKGGNPESLRLMNQPLQYSLPFLSRATEGMRNLFSGRTPEPSSRVAQTMVVAIAISARGLKDSG